MIEIKHLAKSYSPRKTVLHNLSLTINPGVHGLLGPNGAGKTTLMRILATLLRPSSGQVTVFGHDLQREKQAIRNMMGYLPQDFGFYPGLTATETLDYLALISGIRSAKEREYKIRTLLESVNLWSVQGEKVRTFSGGMKQRLGIAQMLLSDPKVIIVDEPTAGLDPQERVSFRSLIGELCKENKKRIVIISTHIVDDLTHVASNLMVLHKGNLLYQGAAANLAAEGEQAVYTLEVPSLHVEEIKREHLVIATMPGTEHDKVLLRFLKQRDPLPKGANPTIPTLEDGYLALVGKEAVGLATPNSEGI